MVHNESQQKSYFYEKKLVDSAEHVRSQNDATMYFAISFDQVCTARKVPRFSQFSTHRSWPVKGVYNQATSKGPQYQVPWDSQNQPCSTQNPIVGTSNFGKCIEHLSTHVDYSLHVDPCSCWFLTNLGSSANTYKHLTLLRSQIIQHWVLYSNKSKYIFRCFCCPNDTKWTCIILPFGASACCTIQKSYPSTTKTGFYPAMITTFPNKADLGRRHHRPNLGELPSAKAKCFQVSWTCPKILGIIWMFDIYFITPWSTYMAQSPKGRLIQGWENQYMRAVPSILPRCS